MEISCYLARTTAFPSIFGVESSTRSEQELEMKTLQRLVGVPSASRLPSMASFDPSSPEAIELLRRSIEEEKRVEMKRAEDYSRWAELPDVVPLGHELSPPFILLWPDDSPLFTKISDVFLDESSKNAALFDRLDSHLKNVEMLATVENNFNFTSTQYALFIQFVQSLRHSEVSV